MRTKAAGTCYINNDYTNVTKDYEDYIRKQAENTKSAERQKKNDFPKE